MKKLSLNKFIILACAAWVFMFSCSKKEDNEEENNSTNDTSLEYLDQNLQGEIENTAWEMVVGNTKRNWWNGNYEFKMVNILGDTCFLNFVDTAYGGVIFSLTPENFKVGQTLTFNNFENITLVEYTKNDGPHNFGVFNGKLELTKIDTVNDNIVEGKVVGKYDKDNFVNGNFTIKYCQ